MSLLVKYVIANYFSTSCTYHSDYDDNLGVSSQRRKQTKSSADLMEEMTSQLPRKLIIAQEQLQVLDISLGQGKVGYTMEHIILMKLIYHTFM